jgi:para-aminobenzoate synthetase/4-amino-4-deoxychorismate lyase
MLEWRECLHKAAPLLAAVGASVNPDVHTAPCEPTEAQLAGGLLETILAMDGRVLRLADHLARLDRSLRELYGVGLPDDTAERVMAFAGPGRVAIRVRWRAGAVAVSGAATGPSPEPSAAIVVSRSAGLWRHKWADRAGLAADEEFVANDALHSAPLYVAADGTVLETSRGSVFSLGPDGSLVTPPLRDDLLPGVTRRALLDLARDTGRPHEVRPLQLAELTSRAAFWTSSLSLAVPIHTVDGVALPRQDEVVQELAVDLVHGGAAVR